MSEPQVTSELEGVAAVIVEDNFAVADGLKWALESFGCVVNGMAGTIESAEKLVSSKTFDVAILDIDLKGRSVAPIAELLTELGKPFIFLTGYAGVDMLPTPLQGSPRLSKPIEPEVLVEEILKIKNRH